MNLNWGGINYGGEFSGAGWNDAGFGYGDAVYDVWRSAANNHEQMLKSLTTGDSVVAAGDTGGADRHSLARSQHSRKGCTAGRPRDHDLFAG